MDRAELQRLFDQEGVDARAYCLDGALIYDDSIVLQRLGPRWAVYYSERGGKSLLKRLDTEDEACEYMAAEVLRDEHNRFHLVAGPAPPDEAAEQFKSWLNRHAVTRDQLTDHNIKIDKIPGRAGAPYRRYLVRRSAIRDLQRDTT